MAAPAKDMIVIKDLVKQFGPLRAVDGVSLSVPHGQVTVIIGPSGSGKSTVLRCINHLETPSGGEIWVDGKRLTSHSKDINAVRAEVGMVFQQFNLFPHLTTLENIVLAQKVVRRRQQNEAERIGRQQLERVGIPEKASSYPGQLSGGQQQRVAIARALAMNPKIMLFDEPTSALDPELVGDVLRVIKDLASQGWTMVIVTHEIRFAQQVADQVLFIDGGTVLESGPPQQVLVEPAEARTRQFLQRILDPI
jgi:polar amino acid transport system ATP-binding protein